MVHELSSPKCTALNVTRKRKKKANIISTAGQATENVTTTKYLGVNIQDNMKWGININTITNRANKTLGFLRRNLKIGNKKTEETANKALV